MRCGARASCTVLPRSSVMGWGARRADSASTGMAAARSAVGSSFALAAAAPSNAAATAVLAVRTARSRREEFGKCIERAIISCTEANLLPSV
ncbi:hypothetical protein D3C72_1618820 [compost metagenome]